MDITKDNDINTEGSGLGLDFGNDEDVQSSKDL